MAVAFADDQMRARTDHTAHKLFVVRRFALNLIRYPPVTGKGDLKTQSLRAAIAIVPRRPPVIYKTHAIALEWLQRNDHRVLLPTT